MSIYVSIPIGKVHVLFIVRSVDNIHNRKNPILMLSCVLNGAIMYVNHLGMYISNTSVLTQTLKPTLQSSPQAYTHNRGVSARVAVIYFGLRNTNNLEL